MVVENLFKQTELGLIPKDWDIYKFSEVSFMKGRIGWQGLKQTEFTFNSDEPFLITGMNFKDGAIRWNEVYHVSEDRYQIAREIQLKSGDVLMTKDGTIGKLLYVEDIPFPFKATLNSHLLVFRPLNRAYDPKYLYYNLASPYFIKHIELTKSGTTFFGVSQTSVGEYKLILPPLPEQTAIATALSDMDELIAQTEKLIEKKKAIKQGVMQELLRPKEGWVTKKLGEILEYEQPTKYIVKSDKYSDNNSTPVLTAGKSFILGFTSEEFNLFEDLPTIIFDDFTTASQFVDFKFKVKSSAMKILKLRNKKMDLRFIFEMLQNIKYQVADHKRHWIGEFQNIEIFLPELDEMNQLGKIVKEINQEIELLETKQNKLKLQKQGMMQALLTGKIRLV
jgi:type I restriction enzyme S subunit